MKKFVLVLIFLFLLSGCFFDAYKDKKYGKLAIESWFNDEVLGEKRKEIENIDEIKEINCDFKEIYKEKYIFKCNIYYSPAGTTKIPLSSFKNKDVYVVFTPKNKTFDYTVYNSKYDDINDIKEDL